MHSCLGTSNTNNIAPWDHGADTDQRVLGKVGFFSRHTFEIRLSQGEGLAVNQSVFGRLFNFGAITSSGTGASKVSMLYLDSPFEVRKQILSNTK
ncbi:PH domain-containing protein [Vibrio anguillarum]|uniref:PH domain-containing protein n=1 Tax=Vibrio anguillarum TaxID=55601 RepID=UPI000BB50D55|nr:hypothetical protein CMV05_22345 [Vibrio anguillarum]